MAPGSLNGWERMWAVVMVSESMLNDKQKNKVAGSPIVYHPALQNTVDEKPGTEVLCRQQLRDRWK